jgi:hypothetical protein
MSQEMGICAIVPRDQQGYQPRVFGMGILVSDTEVVTCAHVIDGALDLKGRRPADDAVVSVCFPFAGKQVCLDARVDATRWFPPSNASDHPDIAVIRLVAPAPASVERAALRKYNFTRLADHPLKVYGFQSKVLSDGSWVSHPTGETSEGRIVGPLPGGRAQFDGLPVTGAAVQHGFSGAGVYDPNQDAVVGMVVETDKDRTKRVSQIIGTPSLEAALGTREGSASAKARDVVVRFGLKATRTRFQLLAKRFLSTYLGTAGRPVPFGGRNDEITRLNHWLDDPTRPHHLLITAPAGSGKTALIVRWIEQLPIDLTVVFVPISIRYETNRAADVYQALAAQLAAVLEVRPPAPPLDAEEFYKEKVIEYLDELSRSDRQCLVVIDGLDEAVRWKLDEAMLPDDLRRGLRIVASARLLAGDKGPADWLRRLGWHGPGERAEAMPIGPLTPGGIADVLEKQGIDASVSSNVGELIKDLYRVTEHGDPLLLSLLLADLFPLAASGVDLPARLSPSDLKNMDAGLDHYFKQWFGDQEKAWKQNAEEFDREILEALLAILSCALGPIRLAVMDEMLRRVLPTVRVVSARTVEPLRRFVLGDGVEVSYVLSHPKLAQYLQYTYFGNSATIRSVREQFVSWGRDVLALLNAGSMADASVLDYVLPYHAQHLRDANAPRDAFLELVSNGWRLAWETRDVTYRGFAADVRNAWDVLRQARRAKDPDTWEVSTLAGEVRCGLCLTSIWSIGIKVGPRLLERCVAMDLLTLPQALMMASIDDSLQSRAERLNAFSAYLPEDERLQEARDVFDLTLTCLPNRDDLPDEIVSGILSALAPWLPEDVLPKAIATADDIRDELHRIVALLAFEPRLIAEDGQQKIHMRALDSAKRTFSWDQALAFARVIPRLPPELVHEALRVAGTLRDEDAYITALAACAARLKPGARELVLEQAVASLEQCNDPAPISRIMVARALPEDHEFRIELLNLALASLRSIFPPDNLSPTLAVLGEVLPPSERDLLLLAAQHGVELGRNTYQSTVSPRAHSAAFEAISSFLSKEALSSALNSARRVADGFACAHALVQLARRLTGDARVAYEAIARRMLADSAFAGGEGLNQDAFLALSDSLTDLPVDTVLQMAQSISVQPVRNRALAAVVPRLPAQQRVEVLASALVEVVAGGGIYIGANPRGDAIRVALDALAPSERNHALQVAVKAASEQESESRRVESLVELAPHLQGALLKQATDTALRHAMQTEKASNRGELLSLVVPILQGRQRETALAAIDAIPDAEIRLDAFSNCAAALTEPRRKAALDIAYRLITDESGKRFRLDTYLVQAASLISHDDLDWFRAALRQLSSVRRGRDFEALAKMIVRFPDLLPEISEKIAPDDRMDAVTELFRLAPDRFAHALHAELTNAANKVSARVSGFQTACPLMLPETRRAVASAILRSIGEEDLASLPVLLPWLPRRDALFALTKLLETFPRQVRKISLRSLIASSDVLVTIGGEEMVESVCRDIVDFYGWWP